jgi:hypothetical protein
MTSLTRIAVALATALLVSLPAASLAQPASMKQRVASAKQQYIAQEYEVVIRLLTPVVQSPIATISAKVAAYELLGLSYLILGDEKRARVAFENLLGLDQGHMLNDPSGSPKLRRFYDSVKESFVPGYSARATVTLEHAAPRRAIAGRRVELAASIVSGRVLMASVNLRWRRAGLLTYRNRRMRGTPRRMKARFLLPEDTASYRLEYYIEARDSAGHAVGRVGSPEAPLTIKVAGALRAESTPVYRKWWFWTLVGAAVVGGITAGVVVGSSDTAPVGSLEPNPVRLQ